MNNVLLSIILFFVTLTASGQIDKGIWQIGVSGAPLFQNNESSQGVGLNGGYFSLFNAYNFNKSFSLSILPYFAFIKDEGEKQFNWWRPKEFYREEYNSFGVNLQPRYYFNSAKLSYYSFVNLGIGKSLYSFEKNDVETFQNFTTYNYGVGVGLSYFMKSDLILDFNISYSRIQTFNNPSPFSFIYPSIGIFKNLNCSKE